MGIDLAGTTLTNASGLVAAASVGQIMKMGPTGILQRNNLGQPMFRAGCLGSAAWIAIGPTNTWSQIVGLSATNVNVGSCYNTGNSRFTAPVSGIYLFGAHTYCLGNAASWGVFSMFWVNGDSALRRPSGGLHRLHGHGQTSGYSVDSETFEIIQLIAGDYVEFWHYSNAASNSYMPQYSRFEGYLLG